MRALQGDKDRGIANVGKQVTELTKQMEKYEAYRADGKDPEAALREMQIDALLGSQGEVSPTTSTPTGEVGTDPQASVVDTKTILTATGLDANDPDVIDLIGKGAKAEGYIALAAQKKAQPETEPNAAQALPVGGGASVPGDTLEQTTAELQEALAKVPVDIEKVRELKAKQAALLKQ